MMASADDKREVLAHHRALKTNIAGALNDLKDNEFPELKAKLLAIQSAAGGFEDYLSTTIEPIYYAEHRSVNSTIAQKVFSIPELLESILESLTIADIMRCYQVSRTMRNIIEASSKLQVKLCLMPASEDSALLWPFQPPTYDYFSCTGEWLGHCNKSVNWATVKPRPGSIVSLPAIGSYWKRMFIRQPPILSMRADIQCFVKDPQSSALSVRHDLPAWSTEINSDTGITIGDLLEVAERLLQEHSACPHVHEDYSGQRQVQFLCQQEHL